MIRTVTPSSGSGRSLLLLGAAGSFSAGAIAVAYVSLTLLWNTLFPFYYVPLLGLALSVLLAIALMLHFLGLLGIQRWYGSTASGGLPAFGVAVSLFFLFSNGFIFIGCLPPDACYRGSSLLLILMVISYVAFGAAFIGEGAVLCYAVHRVAESLAAGLTGVMFAVSGMFLVSLPLTVAGSSYVGILVCFVGGFLVAVVAFCYDGIMLLGARNHPAPGAGSGMP